MSKQLIYLFTGLNKYQIKKDIDQLIQKSGVDELSLAKYDCDETLVEEAINDCMTLSFFEAQKVVIIQNPLFLTSEKSRLDHNLDVFNKYLNKPNESTILIINASNLNLDKRKSVVKTLMKQAKVINHDNLTESEAYHVIDQRFQTLNKSISREAVTELISRTECDALKLYSELDKLSFYLETKEEITIEDVKLLVSEPLENNIFNLTNHILDKKTDQAIQSYHKLIMQNEEPLVFSAILGKNFHLMYVIKQYQNKGYSEYQLRSELKIHPFQLKKLYQTTRYTSLESIERNITLLHEYDINVKTGRVDKYLGFELFILTN